MGRHKIVREFPVKPKHVKWQDGRQKDEIETILKQLSYFIPDEYQGSTSKGILWAVRQLNKDIEEVDRLRHRCDLYDMLYADRHHTVPTNEQLEDMTNEILLHNTIMSFDRSAND